MRARDDDELELRPERGHAEPARQDNRDGTEPLHAGMDHVPAAVFPQSAVCSPLHGPVLEFPPIHVVAASLHKPVHGTPVALPEVRGWVEEIASMATLVSSSGRS